MGWFLCKDFRVFILCFYRAGFVVALQGVPAILLDELMRCVSVGTIGFGGGF